MDIKCTLNAIQAEKKFKWMWADHGDDISRQYAGTGALKSGFTRTGKRTYWGLLDDGIKSGVRYYLNNFSDGRKQDAQDLVTGNFPISGKHATQVHSHSIIVEHVWQMWHAPMLSSIRVCLILTSWLCSLSM